MSHLFDAIEDSDEFPPDDDDDEIADEGEGVDDDDERYDVRARSSWIFVDT